VAGTGTAAPAWDPAAMTHLSRFGMHATAVRSGDARAFPSVAVVELCGRRLASLF
jgi:hypothetical protein